MDYEISLPGVETVTLTGQTIDKLIRAGDGDAALLYLYILKTHGQCTSSEAAIALDKSKGCINSAMAMLSRMGLVRLNDEPTKDPVKEPGRYTEEEAKDAINTSDFSVVVDETQRRLGKILSPDETLRLLSIYNDLRLPVDVILLLITHCINESRLTGDGRAPSIRYIEKAAYTWEREGIFSAERAEEYIKNNELKRDARSVIKNVLNIRDREFSATEKSFVDGWQNMGFEPEAIAIAYDKTIVSTGKLAWQYMDTILKTWHSKNLHTVQQITDKENNLRKRAQQASAIIGAQKHGEPSREQMERITRIHDTIKNG